jgi:hypothetical protein
MKITPLRLLAATLLGALAARGQDGAFEVNVRSGVDLQEQARRVHDPAYAQTISQRGRRFFLARVSEEKNGLDLVKPVDAHALAKEVSRQLEAQGFHAVQGTEKPDIVITVKYGRGTLPNPYAASYEIGPGARLSNSGNATAVWGPLYDHFVGIEEKRQGAAYEKLAIEVRAWKYPPPADPKETEELLWATTMCVDDPDHRDLNLVAAEMIAAGAAYFDRPIKQEDAISTWTHLPDGHVKVGTPEVVPPAAH